MRTRIASGIVAVALMLAGCGVTIEQADGGGVAEAESSSDRSSAEVDTNAADDEGSDGGTDDDRDGGVSERDGSDDTAPDDSSDDDDSGSSGEESSDDEGSEGSAGNISDGLYVAPDGGVENGYDLQFEVAEGGTVIRNLEANVLVTCSGESTSDTTTIYPSSEWEIVDGAFSGRIAQDYSGTTYYTTLEGRFTDSGTAVGIVREEGVVGGSVCDTYELDFTAELS